MGATLPPEPVEIELKRADRTLRVTWDDGHTTVYGLNYLRGYCPCAMCQGHGGNWDYVQTEPSELTEIREVGNYALGLTWSDGHSTGIYSYEVLRKLCPCGHCVHSTGPSHPLQRMGAEQQDG